MRRNHKSPLGGTTTNNPQKAYKNMKNAYIITNSEMFSILKEHLSKNGYNTDGLTVRFTSTNAVVAGIHKLEAGGTTEPEGFDDEEPEQNDGFVLTEAVLEAITSQPLTVTALAEKCGVEPYYVIEALGDLGDRVESVAPARENGCTVSMWMKTGTEAYEQFVVEEKDRVEKQTAKWVTEIFFAVPKFYEQGAGRPEVVETICERISPDAAEELRRDAKAIFYRMKETGKLEHMEHSWRAGKTEADVANVMSLQGAVREILMAEQGLDREAIASKLPGEVEDGLLSHAIKRMDDVYEQDGLLFHGG